MIYERTVAAAVAETKSKFALAEALAEDIPPRRPGPSEDAKISEYIADARQAIIEAGGEPRTVETLKQYRWTALWVRYPGGSEYRWVSGASFTAHRRAMESGLSHDEFSGLDKQTGDAVHEYAGRPAIRTGPSVTRNWTSEQKAEAARELLAQPEVAEQVAADDAAVAAVERAALHRRETERADLETRRRSDPGHRQLREQSEIAVILHELSKANVALGEVISRLANVDLSEEVSTQIGSYEDRLRHKIDWIRSSLTGQAASLDDELTALLAGGE